MFNAYQITRMNDAQMDEFLKTTLVRYVKKTQGMSSLDLLNALLNFAQNEGIIVNEDKDHKDLILNRVNRALTKTTKTSM